MTSPASREVWAWRPVPNADQSSALTPITLGDALNAGAFGGTATVHRVLTQPFHFMAAKVFNDAVLATRRAPDAYAKLRFIAANSERLKRGFVHAGTLIAGYPFVAWPEVLLFRTNSATPENLIGFAMPLLTDAHPLSRLTSPKQRKVHFPDAGAEGLLTAAQNIAKAVLTLHGDNAQSGILIGDLTPRNVMITPDLKCKLIDADSFQFTLSSAVHATADSTPGFRSPRMADAAKSGAALPPVKPADDVFCLAIVLFHVLVDGAHPWTAGERFEIDGIKPDEDDNIRTKSFPYADPARCFPPRIRLHTYQKMHADIRGLFETAFLTPKPPSPQHWVDTLARVRADMSTRSKLPLSPRAVKAAITAAVTSVTTP